MLQLSLWYLGKQSLKRTYSNLDVWYISFFTFLMTSCIFSFVKRCALTLQKLNALNGFVKLLHYLFNYKIFICLVSEWLGYLYYQFYKCNKYEPYHYFNHIKRLKTLLAFLCNIMNSPYIITCIIWKQITIIKITN